eukprot:2374432-Rhodomonas_salina.1
MYGDGAFGFSVAELDTFVRHKVPVICVIGNDAGWTQILREQQTLLGRPTGLPLPATPPTYPPLLTLRACALCVCGGGGGSVRAGAHGLPPGGGGVRGEGAVSYTHLRAHETEADL